MAKAGSKSANPAARRESDAAARATTPAVPDGALYLNLIRLSPGKLLHRIHLAKYKATQFNPGKSGNARFSPLRDASGKTIPTLYAGTTMACALMETVFHDVPHVAGFKSFDKGKLRDQQHSVIKATQGLQLIDLSTVALRKLGIRRTQLIDTEKDQYPATRQWAEAMYRQCPQAQGLCWTSRQDDSARAFLFFGDRVPAHALAQQRHSRPLLDEGDAYADLLDLAGRIGVNIVPGMS